MSIEFKERFQVDLLRQSAHTCVNLRVKIALAVNGANHTSRVAMLEISQVIILNQNYSPRFITGVA
jgi:hypothetical protein